MKEKNTEEALAGCLAMTWVFIFGIALMFLNALYLKLAWSWVIVPAFGVNPLSYWLALGLMMFISLFVKQYNYDNDGDALETGKQLVVKETGLTINMGILFLVSLAI